MKQNSPSYYNYVPEDDNESRDAVHHLPVEPRNLQKQNYQSTPPQRIQVSYSSIPSKQSTSSQPLISEDEYLELIRSTDLVQSVQSSSSRVPSGYSTTTAENTYNTLSTKSPFSNNEFKKFTSRTHVPSNSQQQQQFVRQLPHYSHPTHFITTTPQEIGSSVDKDTVRVNLKQYHETVGKAKYDPARHEVSVKPTKKVVSFKPSYQYTSTAQTQISNQQPLHYQSVQQITQSEQPKSGQQQASHPQSQYSIVVPQYPAYLPQNERLVADNFEQSGTEQINSPTDHQQNEQPEFQIQFVQHISSTPTPTPTPTPRNRFVSDSQSQPLKYELFDAKPKNQEPHVHRPQYADSPQYYKKIKVQQAAQVQYVPVRTQFPQQPQASAQAQSDLLIPIGLKQQNNGKITLITKIFR